MDQLEDRINSVGISEVFFDPLWDPVLALVASSWQRAFGLATSSSTFGYASKLLQLIVQFIICSKDGVHLVLSLIATNFFQKFQTLEGIHVLPTPPISRRRPLGPYFTWSSSPSDLATIEICFSCLRRCCCITKTDERLLPYPLAICVLYFFLCVV